MRRLLLIALGGAIGTLAWSLTNQGQNETTDDAGALIDLGSDILTDYKHFTQRGIRDNNPGNLELASGITWQGQVGSDGVYLQFDTMAHGVRALALDIKNSFAAGRNTVSTFITHYAPPSDNDTAAYITDVCNRTGFGPDDQLTADQATLTAMVSAICWHENGVMPISDADMSAGVTAALGA